MTVTVTKTFLNGYGDGDGDRHFFIGDDEKIFVILKITFIVYTSRNFKVSLIFKVRDSEYHILNNNDNMIHPEDRSLLLIFKMFPKVT